MRLVKNICLNFSSVKNSNFGDRPITPPWFHGGLKKKNKKHSENSDTSTSVTCRVKIRQSYVNRCRYLYAYCTMVPSMMSVVVDLIIYDIWPSVHILWPLTLICDLQCLSRSLSLWSLDLDVPYVVTLYMHICSIKFEIDLWTIVFRKLKWRHNDVITHLIFKKLKCTSTKDIS